MLLNYDGLEDAFPKKVQEAFKTVVDFVEKNEAAQELLKEVIQETASEVVDDLDAGEVADLVYDALFGKEG